MWCLLTLPHHQGNCCYCPYQPCHYSYCPTHPDRWIFLSRTTMPSCWEMELLFRPAIWRQPCRAGVAASLRTRRGGCWRQLVVPTHSPLFCIHPPTHLYVPLPMCPPSYTLPLYHPPHVSTLLHPPSITLPMCPPSYTLSVMCIQVTYVTS